MLPPNATAPMAMQMNIKATNISLTDSIRVYLDEKMQMLNKQFDLENDHVFVHVELEGNTALAEENEHYRAEANLDAGTIHLRAEGRGSTIEEGIDEMKNDLLRRVIDYREKETDFARKGAAEAKKMLRSEEAMRATPKLYVDEEI